MKTTKDKLQLGLLYRIWMNLNMFFFLICAEFEVKKHQEAAFIKKTILNRV